MNFSGFLTVWKVLMEFRICFRHNSVLFSLQNAQFFSKSRFSKRLVLKQTVGSSIAIYSPEFVDFDVYAVFVIVSQPKSVLISFLNAFRRHQNTVENLYTELPYTNRADFGARPWCIAVAL